jgi:hypothetical protein
VELSEAARKSAETWGVIASGLVSDPAERSKIEGQGRMIAEAVKDVLPGASDEVLFTFVSTVASIAAIILKTPLQSAGEVAETYFDAYAVAGALIAGTYHPPDDEATADDNTGTGLYL